MVHAVVSRSEGRKDVSGQRWKTWGKAAIKWGLAALVLWAVGRQIARTWAELHAEGRSLRIDAGWLGVAVALYLAGLVDFGVVYWRIMAAGPTPLGFPQALRAYLISHLGKYVPGKAMVVVIRVGLATPYGARPATAAFATLYETLVMMAAGGLIAAIGFASAGAEPIALPI